MRHPPPNSPRAGGLDASFTLGRRVRGILGKLNATHVPCSGTLKPQGASFLSVSENVDADGELQVKGGLTPPTLPIDRTIPTLADEQCAFCRPARVGLEGLRVKQVDVGQGGSSERPAPCRVRVLVLGVGKGAFGARRRKGARWAGVEPFPEGRGRRELAASRCSLGSRRIRLPARSCEAEDAAAATRSGCLHLTLCRGAGGTHVGGRGETRAGARFSLKPAPRGRTRATGAAVPASLFTLVGLRSGRCGPESRSRDGGRCPRGRPG